MKKPPVDYIKKAHQLKKLGLINLDLRKKLTPADKRIITLKYDKYNTIIKYPENNTIKTVSKSLAAKLKDSGYKVYKSSKSGALKAVIPHYEKSKVTIKKDIITIEGISRSYNLFPVQRSKFFELAEKLSEIKLKGNQYLTAQIGGNRPFLRSFRSGSDLMKYVSDKFNPEIIEHLTIVTIVRHGKK